MKHFFKILMTIFSEPRILRETWDKEVHFPQNYWRTELCVYFLCKDDKNDLPSALRYNFCPLFWFSNLILLIAPLWLPIYLVIKSLNLFCKVAVTPNLDSYQAWNSDRKKAIKSENKQKERDRIKAIKFDPTNINVNRLQRGKAFINWLLWSAGAIVSNPEEDDSVNSTEVDWDNPLLLEQCDEEEAYFMAFRRMYGSDWPREFDKTVAEHDSAVLERTRREKALRLIETQRVQAVQADLNKMFASVFSWSKIICKAVLFLLALPVIYYVAIGCYKLAIWLFYAIGWLLWFLFVENLSTTTIGIAIILGIFIVGGLLAYLISEKIIQSFTGSIFAKMKPVLDLVANTIVAVIVNPISWICTKIASVASFAYNFIRMFYVSNCPGIKYPDEK